MEILLKLIAVGMIPVVLSVIMYFLCKKTKFGQLSYWTQQIIIGILFGFAAICGTLFGVDVGGATANARDAAPLCAGLLFSGPAGIIAGVIGGVHRYFAAYYGAGMYSQIACSVSTFLAGILAAVLRKYMFNDQRVGWTMAALIAVVMEVVHLIILFLTHLNDAEQAFNIVKIVTVPMIIANAFAVGMAAGILQVLARLFHKGVPKKLSLAEKIQKWLLVTVFFAYIITTLFVYVLQSSSAIYSAQKLLITNLEDVSKDITNGVDNEMIARTKVLTTQYMNDGSDNSRLQEYADSFGFQYISVVNAEGVIVASTEPQLIGISMTDSENATGFMKLTRYIIGSYVQDFADFQLTENGVPVEIKCAGVVLQDGGFIMTGYDHEGYYNSAENVIAEISQNRRIGQTGYIIISDSTGRILSDREGHSSQYLSEAGIDLARQVDGICFDADVYGEKSMCMNVTAVGFNIIGVLPYSEIYQTRDTNIYINSYMEVVTFALLFAVIFFLIKFIVVNDIHKINHSLEKIIGGKLDERVEMDSTVELTQLSGFINKSVETLNSYITAAAERMKKDLDLATDIQQSALPTVFPPYPEVREFDVYATMNTAKEVGGDFYDFFLLGSDKLAFVIADVSGKGIPAAMFMMRAKTLIKSQAETGKDAAAVITEVNNQLCQNNDAGMFVTAWFGILDYSTGKVSFVNAGHNPPLLGKKDGEYNYLKTRAGLVLAGMEGVPYRAQELVLNPGDRLFLYTDGVTEATSINTELYGEDRLRDYLNEHRSDPISQIPGGVIQDINVFIEGADQFDDITMLIVEYKGKTEA